MIQDLPQSAAVLNAIDLRRMSRKHTLIFCLAVLSVLAQFVACRRDNYTSKKITEKTVTIPTILPGMVLPASEEHQSVKVIPRNGEEPAVGPDFFDVLQDGSVIIADRAQNRRVTYSLTDSHAIFQSARAQIPLPTITPASTDLSNDRSILIDGRTAKVVRVLPNGAESALNVSIRDRNNRLVSVESLGTESSGSTYLLLELGSMGDKISVNRLIRKYDRLGNVAMEISTIPDQQEISPHPEFRVRAGIIYQMVVGQTVSINVWNTNEE